MLESFYESPTHLRRKRRGPLGPYIDDLAADLLRRGYARGTGREILTTAGRFSVFAELRGVEDAKKIRRGLIDRFLVEDLGSEGVYHDARNSMSHVVSFLEKAGILVEQSKKVAQGRCESLLRKYDDHMSGVRGLIASTRRNYIRYARELLVWYRQRYKRRSLNHISRADVVAFITDRISEMPSTRQRQSLCTSTRSFLRYLRWEGAIKEDMSSSVPTVPCPRLASVPRHLPWKSVRIMIDGIDTSDPEGMRDKAILLLIATAGLRSYEVRAIKFSDISWRVGEVRVRRTKSRKERIVPLVREAGQALADYILHGRPPVEGPYVFVRHKAPYGNFIGSAAIYSMVKRHLRKAGLFAPHYGSRILRQSLATQMVNKGVPIKDVADLFGHQSIDTTAIYTKVDIRNLVSVALPFPGGVA